jgi:hypothetical protein
MAGDDVTASPLSTATATDVLQQMHAQLGDYDPDQRALVGVRHTGEDEVAMTDLELTGDGVLRVDDGVHAIVLVTGDDTALAEQDQATPLRQLLAVLRSGEEVGVFRLGDDTQLYSWTTETDDEHLAELRPRSLEANLARRAFGLPSHIDDVHVTEFLGRLYLLHLAQLTLERFDDGEHIVTPADLESADTDGPFAVLLSDDAFSDDDIEAARELAEQLTWEHVRSLAARGDLHVGPYRFTPEQATFLDAPGFAQHFDEELMSATDLIGALETMGDDELVGWALGRLLERDWLSPTIALAAGDLAAAAQLASTDPRYGEG